MLFDPIRVGTLELPNRLMRSATWEGMATNDGAVTDAQVDLFRTLARGGVGLIVTGFAYVSPSGKALPHQTGIYDDAQIAGLARIAGAVHAEGGRVAVQIVHAGAQTRPEWIGDEILKRGEADGVSLARPFIREPDLPLRWRSGDPAVSECISCKGCLRLGMKGGIACAQLGETS